MRSPRCRPCGRSSPWSCPEPTTRSLTMPLHPDARKVIDDMAAMGPMPEPGAMTAQEMRDGSAAAWVRPGPFEPVGNVEDRTIPGPAGEMPVRVFTPAGEG